MYFNLFVFIFRRNKSNFRDDQTNVAFAQSSLNSNDTTHPPQNIRRYYLINNYIIFGFYFYFRIKIMRLKYYY